MSTESIIGIVAIAVAAIVGLLAAAIALAAWLFPHPIDRFRKWRRSRRGVEVIAARPRTWDERCRDWENGEPF